MEYKLWALLLLIIDRGGLRKPRPNTQGCVIDAGAHDGTTAVMLSNAVRHLNLQVHALEPLSRNEELARAAAQNVPSLYVYRLGLGEVDGATGHYPAEYDARKSSLHLQIARFRAHDNAGNASYPLTTIDFLFNDDTDRTLVLAHLDLEGHEASACAAPTARSRATAPCSPSRPSRARWPSGTARSWDCSRQTTTRSTRSTKRWAGLPTGATTWPFRARTATCATSWTASLPSRCAVRRPEADA